MQATLGCLSRLVSRSLVTGVVNSKQQEGIGEAKLITAVSGFPKQKTGYNIENILKGQIGEDAYFVARHVDDWEDCNNNSNEELCPSGNKATEVAAVNNGADVIGVADGVGGWRQYGVDPGQFSTHLMRNCERLVKSGFFSASQPAKLLAQGFREMQESKTQIVGSSTACVMMLNHSDARMYTANMGDSGFLVVRGDRIVHRSQEQQHTFNTPFQLSLPPSEMARDVLADRPEAADRYEFNVEDGDVILLATDGLFDNVPDSLLAAEISAANVAANGRDDVAARLQLCANSLALIARKLSQDPNFLSPFAQSARANGFKMTGGKEDDITVLLAAVRLSAEHCEE